MPWIPGISGSLLLRRSVVPDFRTPVMDIACFFTGPYGCRWIFPSFQDLDRFPPEPALPQLPPVCYFVLRVGSGSEARTAIQFRLPFCVQPHFRIVPTPNTTKRMTCPLWTLSHFFIYISHQGTLNEGLSSRTSKDGANPKSGYSDAHCLRSLWGTNLPSYEWNQLHPRHSRHYIPVDLLLFSHGTFSS